MPKSEQQQRAADSYLRDKVDTFVTRVPKGKKAELQAHATTKGESLNKFVNRAIDETIQRDNNSTPIMPARNLLHED